MFLRTWCSDFHTRRFQYSQSGFEIIAFNLADGIDTIAALDRRLQPVVEKTWGGRTLPFPTLVDGTSTTMENFGVEAFPTAVLIDPEGKLLKDGSLELLKQKLGANK